MLLRTLWLLLSGHQHAQNHYPTHSRYTNELHEPSLIATRSANTIIIYTTSERAPLQAVALQWPLGLLCASCGPLQLRHTEAPACLETLENDTL